jgi:hypothetical protein
VLITTGSSRCSMTLRLPERSAATLQILNG